MGISKNFAGYQFDDFVADESFINYCLYVNPADIVFWENWIMKHPEKSKMLEKAEYYVRNFSFALPDEYQNELTKIENSTEPSTRLRGHRSVPKYPGLNISSKNIRKNTTRRVIAVLAILLAGGYFFVKKYNHSASDLIENFNSGNVPFVFTIPDGTVITLARHSGLKYPRKFNSSIRKVYLEGGASFHVTADPACPFKVYQNDLMTTVLGTVFNIRNERRDSLIVVELIKGSLRVEIIGRDSKIVHSITLQPNERAVYTRFNRRLSREK